MRDDKTDRDLTLLGVRCEWFDSEGLLLHRDTAPVRQPTNRLAAGSCHHALSSQRVSGSLGVTSRPLAQGPVCLLVTHSEMSDSWPD
jgi:hypothetical protein